MGVVTIYGKGYVFRGLTLPKDTINYRSRFNYARFRDCCFERNVFKDCDFSNARVVSASYKEADFEFGTYEDTHFDRCDFSLVNFECCLFRNAFFTHCKFTKARLARCIFKNCVFSDCQLGYIGAPTFCDGEIVDCSYVPYIPMACPESGPIIGYKKATALDDSGRGRGWIDVIVKLEIPEDAKRSSALGRKCRCDKAKVLGIYGIKLVVVPVGMRENGVIDTVIKRHIGEKLSDETIVYSKYSCLPGCGKDVFPYKVGQWVYPDKWCEDRFVECAPGIHFFINAQEAVDY